MSAVRQVEVPTAARARCTLPHIDYADAFHAALESPADRTAEQWTRRILEAAPATIRAKLVSGWSMLGLRLSPSAECVLGWQILCRTPDFVLLGAESRVGMPGQLLFTRQHDGLLFDTFVQQNNVVARALWASVEATHVRTVRAILEHACRKLLDPSSAAEGQR